MGGGSGGGGGEKRDIFTPTNSFRNSPRENHHWDNCFVKNFVEVIPTHLLILLLSEAFFSTLSRIQCAKQSSGTRKQLLNGH